MRKIKELIDLDDDPDTGYENFLSVDGRMRVRVERESDDCGRDGLVMAFDQMLGYRQQGRRFDNKGRYKE